MDPSARACTECEKPTPLAESGKVRLAQCSTRCRNLAARRGAREKYEAELAAKGAVIRQCVNCGQRVAARTGTWPMSHGAPLGRWCLVCFGVRQDKFDAVTQARKAKSPARRMRRLALAQRSIEKAPMLGPDADRAVRLGVATVNAAAPKIAKEFAAAIEDPGHEFHLEALELALQRILPMAAFNAEASQLAKSGALDGGQGTAQDEGPTVTVNVRGVDGK